MSYDLDTRPLYRSEEPPRSPVGAPAVRPLVRLEPTEPEPKKLDLSLTQVVGGALAAMTAAALGSRLGVAGTVIGAAVASVLAAVLGALYTASLRRTRETVRTAFRPRAATAAPIPPANRYPGVATAVSPLVVPAAPLVPAAPRRRVRWWPRVLVGTLATFALAGGAVTGFELLTGHALSGGSGTTIEKVGQAPRGTSSADAGSVQVEPSATSTPSSSTSVEPVPSTQSSSRPSPSSTPSSTPSADSNSAASSATPGTAGPTTPPPTEAAGGVPAG